MANNAIKRIRIKDSQSIKSLDLDFEENGVFRLDGNNDIGKSSILRAVSALFQNVPNLHYKDYISDWADSFEVEAYFYDGSRVLLSRGLLDYYEWELPSGSGRADKTKGKVPEEVEAYFNLYNESVKTKQVLNFNLPGDSLPFVDTSPLDNYWLMQKALGTEDFLKGTRYLNRKINEGSKDLKLILELVEEQNEKLEEINSEITFDKRQLSSVDRFAHILEIEHAALLEMYVLEEDESNLQQIRNTLAALPNVSDEQFLEIVQLENQVAAMTEFVTVATDLQEAKQELEISSNLLNEMTIDEAVSIQEEIQVLEKVLKDSEVVQTSKQELEKLNRLYTELSQILVVEEGLRTISEMEQYIEEAVRIEKQREVLPKHEANLEKLHVEIERLKVELGVCPFCDSDLTIAHNH